LPQSSTITQTTATAAALRPLCVDLDGTLVKSDTLVDSLFALVRTRPAQLVRLPGRLLRGKAELKAFVTETVSIDVASLPLNHALLGYLREERALGRKIYLATGADARLAHRVADHLGIFAGVLASDGATNLTGNRKLDSLRARFGEIGFDYIGNATADLPLLWNATEPMIANPSLALRIKLKARGIQTTHEFIERKPVLQSLLKAVRFHQWAKNLLISVPLLCSHALSQSKLFIALAAFFCFSLAASAGYIVNDLLDMEADRRHPRKLQRPFAAGDLPGIAGVAVAAVFLIAGLAGAAFLPGNFFALLLLYLATTVAYSVYLKRIVLVDVLVLSGLYSLRLLAGGSVTGTPISHWLAGFSMFLFLSLAIVKRYAELENLRAGNAVPMNGRGYRIADLDQLRSFGTASAYAAVIVFAIYITSPDVMKLYHKPQMLWLTVPLMILWLNRVWLLASRGELNEDPVAFALTDAMSLVIGAAVVGVACLAL